MYNILFCHFQFYYLFWVVTVFLLHFLQGIDASLHSQKLWSSETTYTHWWLPKWPKAQTKNKRESKKIHFRLLDKQNRWRDKDTANQPQWASDNNNNTIIMVKYIYLSLPQYLRRRSKRSEIKCKPQGYHQWCSQQEFSPLRPERPTAFALWPPELMQTEILIADARKHTTTNYTHIINKKTFSYLFC